MVENFDFNDIIGKKYNKLTILSLDHITKNKKYMYKCKCDCGNEIMVRRENIISSHTKSCGCLKHRKHTKRNDYEIFSDYVIGYLSNGNTFLVDLDDYEKIKDMYWFENDQGYILTRSYDSGKKDIRLHRYILNVHKTSKPIIDHINGDRKDNRKENLRLCTHQQNMKNRGANKNSITKVKNVSMKKNKNGISYYAYITLKQDNGKYKKISLGAFKTLEEASNARYLKEVELFGEFAHK